MKIYFTRHGDALDDAPTDSARVLSLLGQEEVYQVAKGIKRAGVKPTHIFASPRVRAQQTAQLIAEVFGGTVITQQALDFDFNAESARALIADLPDDAEVFLVGHNPSMSEVVRASCGADVAMKTGAIACVKLMGTTLVGGELKWYVTPRLYRK